MLFAFIMISKFSRLLIPSILSSLLSLSFYAQIPSSLCAILDSDYSLGFQQSYNPETSLLLSMAESAVSFFHVFVCVCVFMCVCMPSFCWGACLSNSLRKVCEIQIFQILFNLKMFILNVLNLFS